MIKRFTKRELVTFIICIILVVIYGSYIGIVRPLREKISSLDDDFESQQKKLRKNLKIIEKAKAMNRQYDQYLSQLKQSGSNEQVMASILSEIEQVAGQLGLKITDLKPKRVKREEYYNLFSVNLTIDSDLNEILQFIYTLQGEPHFFRVDEFTFEKGAQRNSGQALKTRFVLSRILIP